MQITTLHRDGLLEMQIHGRLDNEWAGHLNEAIDEAIRAGSHAIVLDVSGVSFLSSAGIGALVRAHKQCQTIRGFFGIGVAPPHVADVIRRTGLAKMLLCDLEEVRQTRGTQRTTIQPMFRVAAEVGMTFELYDIDPAARLACTVLGDPRRFAGQTYREEDCRAVEFPADSLGLGLGAFGRDFAECAAGFGEFLAVAGAAAQLPTSGTGKPDYQCSQGQFVPRVQVAYGLRCTGGFRQLLRFDSVDAGGRAPFSTVVDKCLALSESNCAGMVFLAESAGLIGAALRRSPTDHATSDSLAAARFAFPEVRQWLSFSPERSFAHSLALVVGVACRASPPPNLAPLLRPLGPQSPIVGHFHAAVFSYRPFKKRMLELRDTVAALFESEDLQGVLHLLHDDREITGGGESEFVRGACWIGPITE